MNSVRTPRSGRAPFSRARRCVACGAARSLTPLCNRPMRLPRRRQRRAEFQKSTVKRFSAQTTLYYRYGESRSKQHTHTHTHLRCDGGSAGGRQMCLCVEKENGGNRKCEKRSRQRRGVVECHLMMSTKWEGWGSGRERRGSGVDSAKQETTIKESRRCE